MELGALAIIKEPSLLALIPLLIYIVLAFKEHQNVAGITLGCIVGIILTGQSLATISDALKAALGSSSVLIGCIIMFGAGLGELMNQTGVSSTMVYWIVKRIGVNTQTKAKISLIICSALVCGMLGTLGGGNAVIAPILLPIMASLGVTPTVVATLFKVSGEIGLILGPLTGVTLITMEVTGLSYGQLMLQAALPFAAVWLIGAWIGANRAQKLTQGKEYYELSADIKNLDEIQISAKEARTTVIFLISFVALVVYGILNGLGTSYALTVMITLAIIITAASWTNMDKACLAMFKGMGTMAGLFTLFISIEVLLNLVTLGGGFDALSSLLGKLAGDNPSILMLIASVVGGFGIEAAAVAEIRIIADMFGAAATSVGLPMGMFAISILAATRLTGSMYPTSNMMGQLGIARCENTKAVLQANWIAVGFVWVFIVVWAFLGVMVMG